MRLQAGRVITGARGQMQRLLLGSMTGIADRSATYRWIVVGVSTAANALAWSVRSTFALFYVAILGALGEHRVHAKRPTR